MSIVKFLKSHGETVIVVILLLLAAYLRLYRISEYLTFLGDEGRDVLVVKRMIVDHKFTLLGPTASVGGFFLGPIYYYFMLPFLWIWKFDPTGPAVMVGLFGVATVYLLYRTARLMFSPFAAFTAASLYALSPLVISFSRSSWNPNLVPFFSLLLFNFLWRYFNFRGSGNILFIGIILGVGIQLHYLFLFLFAVTFIWLLTAYIRKKIGINHFLIMISGYIIGDFLFILFELRHGFPNTRSIIRFLIEGKDTGFRPEIFWSNIQEVLGRLAGRLLIRMPDGAMLAGLSQTVRKFWQEGSLLMGVILLMGLLIYLYRERSQIIKLFDRKKDQSESKRFFISGVMLLVFWSVIPLILFGLYDRAIYDYYLGIMFFVPFLEIGLILDFIRRKEIFKYFSFLVLVFLLYINWMGRPFLYPPNRQLDQVKNISRKVFDIAGGKPFNFALIAPQNSDHAYRYFFEIWGNTPKIIENTQVDPERTSVTSQLIIICEEAGCQPLGNSLWEVAGFGQAEIAGSWDVPFVKIYKLVHYNK